MKCECQAVLRILASVPAIRLSKSRVSICTLILRQQLNCLSNSMIHGHYNLHSGIISLLQSPLLIETNSTEFSLFNLTHDRVYKLPNGTVRFLVLIYTQTDIFTTQPILIGHICNETYQQTARLEYGEKHPQIRI